MALVDEQEEAGNGAEHSDNDNGNDNDSDIFLTKRWDDMNACSERCQRRNKSMSAIHSCRQRCMKK